MAETETTMVPPVDRLESAVDLLAALRRLAAARQIEIRVEPKSLNHIDSPVAFEADGNRWAYAFLLVAAFALWAWGWVAGGLALALGVSVYLTLGRAYVYRRIEQRVRQDALNDLEKWRKVWRFSGLTLIATNSTALGTCASPDGNWMGFVRAMLAAAREPPP
jgi:hypothetical protein